jgi:hypothetical protein
MYCCRQVSPQLRKLLPSFPLILYHVPNRQQQQVPLNCEIFVSCRSVANDSSLLGCDVTVMVSVVTSVSKIIVPSYTGSGSP